MSENKLTDLMLLRVLANRKHYEDYISHINLDLVEPELKTILLDYQKYFTEFESIEVIDFPEFSTWFFHFAHPELPASKMINNKVHITRIKSTIGLTFLLNQLSD